jgi:hypothetical protein
MISNTGKESRIIFPSKFEGIFLMDLDAVESTDR